MGKFFTRDQAERLLPDVEAALREALFLKQEHSEAEHTLRQEAQRIMMAGGVRVDRARFVHQRARKETSAAGLRQAIERIQEFGCLVKDLDIGLIDFPTLFHGREVYLCWKLGESRIEFWHGVDEGFRGRKAIDAEFLAHHRGDADN